LAEAEEDRPRQVALPVVSEKKPRLRMTGTIQLAGSVIGIRATLVSVGVVILALLAGIAIRRAGSTRTPSLQKVDAPEARSNESANPLPSTPRADGVSPDSSSTGRGDGGVSPSEVTRQSAAAVLASFVDNGKTVTIDADGNLMGLGEILEDVQQATFQAVKERRLPLPRSLDSLNPRPGKTMGSPNGEPRFDFIGPAGTVVRTRLPVFTWKALEGASAYELNVFDSAYRKVAASGQVSGTEWVIPFPLRRGAVYSWQVTATVGDKRVVTPGFPAPEAKFKVLDARTEEELAAAVRRSPNSHLLLCILYARAGLIKQAKSELASLAKENRRSGLVRDWTRSIANIIR